MEPNQDDDLTQSGPIDSDEEKDLVMAALMRSRPRPLFEAYRVPLKQKYQMVRMKEMLGNALGGRGGAGLFRTTPREEPNSALNGMNGFGSGMMSGGTGPDGTDRRMGSMSGRMPSASISSRKQSTA